MASRGRDRAEAESTQENDPFFLQLSAYLAQRQELIDRGSSEDSIRDCFLSFLRKTFPRLNEASPILLEEYIPALRVRGGFADALYGDLIFEFKRRLDNASRTEGREELERYLQNQKHPERCWGLLTDGQTVEVYAMRDDELTRVDRMTLSTDRAQEVRLWLDCYLFHEKQLVPTANDVALRFGERSPTFWRSLRILEQIWSELSADATAQTKFVEWQSLLSIVYGSGVGDENLFLRHTYLALFARALAFAVLEGRAPEVTEVGGLIDGDSFRARGFNNFVEDDFFTWVATPTVSDQAEILLREMATRLTVAYDLKAIREDLLKELYQELVDPQTRHDLGEFYTPDWLAELTLRKSGYPPKRSKRTREASLFDPSCGSGTFLFTAIRLLRETGLKGAKLVDACVKNLAGIDVHPLAVTIAKTNFLLALGDDLTGYTRSVNIPVYLADSLSPAKTNFRPDPERDLIRTSVEVDAIGHRSGKKRSAEVPAAFEIPVYLSGKPEVLHQCIEALLEFASPSINKKDAREGFLARLEELRIGEAHHHLWLRNLLLMRWLLEPPVTNSVWRFILNNAYQPEVLARRKFAFVVGNPPWLSYRYIQRSDYQKRIRNLVFDYGLLEKKQTHLFTQMELATLFFAFCEDRFLADDGRIAFVMPRSVLTGAKQHSEFRRRYVAAAELIIDCEQVTPLFNVPACVIICPKLPDPPERLAKPAPVPTLRLQAQLSNRNASLSEVQTQDSWKAKEETFSPLTAVAGSPYWNEVIQGATMVPRCFWFVRPPEIARVLDRRRPQLETDGATERQAKKPWKGIRLTGSVEAEFLYASLLCDHLLPFGWRQLYLVVTPVSKNPNNDLQLLNAQDAIRRGKSGLADWIRTAEAKWKRHRKSQVDLLDYLNWQNKLTRQRPSGVLKVLHNDAGTHICSCVVDARQTQTLQAQGFPTNGFIAEHVTYWFETGEADEAHYLCAMLNAPLADEAIKPYQTRGAFGARGGKGQRHVGRRPFEVLPIPRFDPKDKRHRQLAELSMHCHEKVRQVVEEARATGDEKFFTTPIGRLRTRIRKEVLADELEQIDHLVKAVLELS